MSLRIRDKQSARKATTAAQAAAGVLVACGLAVGAWGLPWLEVREPELVQPDLPPEPTGGGEDQPETTFDAITVMEYLGSLKNAPVPDPVVVAAEPEEAESPAATEGRTVRYIGSVRMGSRTAAFVNVAGVTKLLRPGQAPYEGVSLVSVSDDEIVISIDGGDELTVEKSERQGPAVTLVSGGAPVPPETPVVAGDEGENPRFSPDMSREERRAALIERAREERARWERDRGERRDDVEPPNRN